MSSSFKSLAIKQDVETDNSFLNSLKGLDFAEWNLKVGLPIPKPGREQLHFPLPFQWSIFNELMKEDGSPKDRHVAWLGSRGLSKTETCIRILCYLATKDDSLRNSSMMIITGSRASLSYNIISRIKNLMHKANLDDSSMSYVNLNGIRIEGFPSDSLSARGLPFVSAILVDECAWWEISEIQNTLDTVIGYWPKFHCYTLLASSPSQPNDLMDQIFRQPEEECAWRRLKMDYRFGENTIYTPADIARIRGTSSWSREMLLRWVQKVGSSFSQSDIARAKAQVYDTTPTFGIERTIAVDPGWSSSPAGLIVAELRNGFITILRAEEKGRVTYEDLSEYVYELWHTYQPVSKLFIDSSQVAFIKTMKQILGEDPNYTEAIKFYKSQKLSYAQNMRIEPCYFTTENKRTWMSQLRQALEQGLIMIHPQEHELLLNAMSQCEDVEGIVANKQHLPHNDVLDACFMIMRNYEQ
jgi:hypothetical protein